VHENFAQICRPGSGLPYVYFLYEFGFRHAQVHQQKIFGVVPRIFGTWVVGLYFKNEMLQPSIGDGDALDIFGHCRGYVVIPANSFLEIEQQKPPTLSEADGVLIDDGQISASSGKIVGGVAKMGVGCQPAAPEGEQRDGIAHVVGADGVVLGHRKQREVGASGAVFTESGDDEESI